MASSISSGIPEPWNNLLDVLSVPIAWVPRLGGMVIDQFMNADGLMVAFTYVFLFFPAMLIMGGLWVTQLSLYTLPFRSGRIDFIKMILMAWWDVAMVVWLYWVGLGRVLAVTLGWIFTIGRLAFQMVIEIFRQILILPFSKTGQMSQKFFQPGVPWIAFFMLIFWGLLEGVIFTYTLFPTVTEVLGGIVGTQAPALTGTFLFIFLTFLILGSFACVQALVDAINNKQYKYVIQMLLIEFFVMSFEVMFLYRELVDAITPWIAQQTGEQWVPGLWFTLGIATFGWMGVRGMTWFLFGQFGTPPLLAFISRRPLPNPDLYAKQAVGSEQDVPWWRAPVEDFKREIGWLHEKGKEVLEFVTLPFIHIIAGILNFAMILVAGRPAFMIPFKSLQEVLELRENLSFLQSNRGLESKKVPV